jgi:hypothetical protein
MKKKNWVLCLTCALVMNACTNKDAEYNNKANLIHASFQNSLSDLSELLENDSTSSASAIQYIDSAYAACMVQKTELKNLKAPEKASTFHKGIDALFAQQLEGLVIRKRLYSFEEPSEDFSNLQDSLSISDYLVDSLDANLKLLQLDFAKASKFSLQVDSTSLKK